MTDARPANPTSPLANADALAERGDWLGAIEAWRVAADEHPPLRTEIERRLDWFLRETGHSLRTWRRVLPPVLVFLMMSALGMASLLFAGEPGSTSANLSAAFTWIAVAVASVAALVAARRTGNASLGDRIARARHAAAQLAREASTGENA